MNYQTRLVLPLLLLAAAISGCTDPCSIPLEQAPRLRILNAMADQQEVNVYINGTLVQANLAYNPPVTYNPPSTGGLGYLSTFASGINGDSQPLGDLVLADHLLHMPRSQGDFVVAKLGQGLARYLSAVGSIRQCIGGENRFAGHIGPRGREVTYAKLRRGTPADKSL